MPLDASIYSQVNRPTQPVPSRLDSLARAYQLQELEMKSQQGQQAMQDDQDLRSAYRSSAGDNNKLLQLLQQGGQYGAAQKVQKSIADAAKAKGDLAHVDAQTEKERAAAGKTKQETRFAAATQHAQSVINVQTPDDAVAYIDEGIANGVFPAEARGQAIQKLQQYPSVEAWKQAQTQAAIPVLERYKKDAEMARAQLSADTSIKTTGMNNDTSRFTNAASIAGQAEQGRLNRGNSMAIAGMADARAREQTAASMSKPFEVTGPDGNPVLVQQDKQGNITPVQGYKPKGGAEKPLNDTQSKALLFGSRMREADKVLEELAKSGTTTSVPGSRAGYGIGSVVTALSSAQKQQIDQAKRDFVNAVLRRESGAVIADSEFENADKQYFPQIGDSREVVAQKNRNRKLATDGILLEVPENRRNSLKPQAQMPSADDIRKQADNILKGG